MSKIFGDSIFRAKVAVPGANEATIIPPDATTPTQKAYKYALSGMTLNQGDFVYVIPISGTYVLLGGAVDGGEGNLPAGGTAGQIPVKASAADYDLAWQYPRYSRPNLLDNWYFVQNGGLPVNQRGQNQYSTAGTFTLDRWKLISGTVELTANGLILNGELQQTIEETIDQQCTASVLTANDVVDASFNPATKVFSITSDGSSVIKAAKLELGLYQTLAHQDTDGNWALNEIPDVGEEQRKCQRYFVRYGVSPFLFTSITAANGANLEFSLPLKMANGAIRVSGSPSMILRCAGVQYTASEYIKAWQDRNGYINLTFRLTATAPANEAGCAWINGGNLDVEIN